MSNSLKPDRLRVFGEEAQSGVSRVRQPAEGARFTDFPMKKASGCAGVNTGQAFNVFVASPQHNTQRNS